MTVVRDAVVVDVVIPGMFVMQWTSGAASFINTFVAPIALANIGYWVSSFIPSRPSESRRC